MILHALLYAFMRLLHAAPALAGIARSTAYKMTEQNVHRRDRH
jgi:hypothetical protein